MFYIEKISLLHPKLWLSEPGDQIMGGEGGQDSGGSTDQEKEANHTTNSAFPLQVSSPVWTQAGQERNFTLNQVWSFTTMLDHASKNIELNLCLWFECTVRLSISNTEHKCHGLCLTFLPETGKIKPLNKI